MSSKNYVIELLKIRNVEVIGSASDENLKYRSDIDLQEYVYHNQPKKIILQLFQEKYKEAKQNKKIFITDFKCGFTGAGVPLRWDYETIQKGYQYLNGVKYTFISQLKKKSIIKMDIIALFRGRFVEFSNNYYFIFNKKYKTQPKKDNILKSMLIDANNLQATNQFMKSLKRIYIFLKYMKIDNEDTKKLIDLFNSKYGKLSKQISDLKMIKDLYNNNFRKPLQKDINHNLQLIKNELPSKYKPLIDPLLTSNNFVKDISEVIQTLNNALNTKLIDYVKEHQINYNPSYYYNKYKLYRPMFIDNEKK